MDVAQRSFALSDAVTLLDFGKVVLRHFEAGIDTPELRSQIRSRLGQQSLNTSIFPVAAAADYDETGTELWNSAKRHAPNNASLTTSTLAMIQTLSVYLLDLAHRASTKKRDASLERVVRVLRTSLKAARSCIRVGELDICTEVLQRSADHVAKIDGRGKSHMIEGQAAVAAISDDLTAEYWLIRATLSWKQSRLDMVEEYLSNLDVKSAISYFVRVQYANLAHAISRDLSGDDKGDAAVQWLQRAARVLDTIADDVVSAEAVALRSTLTRDLARTHLAQGDDKSIAKAQELLSVLEAEESQPRTPTLILKFEVLSRETDACPKKYGATLMQLIQTAVLSETTFLLILTHFQRLYEKDRDLARQILDAFMSNRLHGHEVLSMLEKAVVMRLWLCTSDALVERLIEDTRDVLTATSRSLASGTRFGQDAIHAALTIVWKCSDICMTDSTWERADQWCQLAFQDLFADMSETNRAKLVRRRINIALKTGQTAHGHEIFQHMSVACQREVASQYLLFKLAVCAEDCGSANVALKAIIAVPGVNTTYLFGCIESAMQTGQRGWVVATMQTISSSPAFERLEDAQKVTMLRCGTQMLLTEAEGAESSTDDLIVENLEKAAVCLTRDDSHGEIVENELKWFAATSWNTALKQAEANSPHLDRVIEVCITLHKALFHVSTSTADARYRLCLCYYLGVISHTTSARSQDSVSEQHRHYASVIRHCELFIEAATAFDQLQPSTPTQTDDVSHRSAEMSRYILEAYIRLDQWAQFTTHIDTTLSGSDEPDHLALLADMVITAHELMQAKNAPAEYRDKIPEVLQVLVNKSWRGTAPGSGGGDMTKLARWLRCTFRMTVDTAPEVARRVLEQAGGIAVRQAPLAPPPMGAQKQHGRKGKGQQQQQQPVSQQQRYPLAELEWLVSTAFNTAVDRHCLGDAAGCRVWAEAALNLAQCVGDSPGLYAQVQGSWARLQQAQL